MASTVKPHAAFKTVLPRSEKLENHILSTMEKIAKIVGGTLGPGGHPVLIERQEMDLAPMVTKDGVTVFRSLGFPDAVDQNILEAARDASVRTAVEAGDGTTTATILAEAFVRYTLEYCKKNPGVPPIKVIKTIQNVYKNVLEPLIDKSAITCSLGTETGRKLLHSVATLSGNGDTELGDAVMKCFDICGDDGNVTIIESSGPTSYEVESIKGFPIAMGYEESCAKFFPTFINDNTTQRIVADKPLFLLYLGRITDFQNILPALVKVADGWKDGWITSHNLVVVATGFSESVLAQFAFITGNPEQINVFPLVVPQSPLMNGQKNFLDDLAAVTGATVLDQVTRPLETIEMVPDDGEGSYKTDFGNIKIEENDAGTPIWVPAGVTTYECGRYRSSVVGFADEELLLQRLEVVKQQLASSESKLESDLTNERVAKLTGGIAKLKVIGSSNGELKERRDRAEDAVCAVRGALKHGALIGGGWMLAKLINALDDNDPVQAEIIKLALWMPIITLYENAGLDTSYESLTKDFTFRKNGKLENVMVRDISKNEVVNAIENGILDSLPAVREALKNSISIATLLGTLGGCVVYPRDKEVDKIEGADYNSFIRDSGWNPANERA